MITFKTRHKTILVIKPSDADAGFDVLHRNYLLARLPDEESAMTYAHECMRMYIKQRNISIYLTFDGKDIASYDCEGRVYE